MSIKLVFVFFLFMVLSVYLAFLNPHKVPIQITQSYSFQLPFVVFLLGSILVGAIITAVFNWTVKVRRSLWEMRDHRKQKREEQRRGKSEQLYEEGENAFAGGRFDKARSFFEKVLAQHPQHVGSLHRLGILKRKEGEYQQAIDLHLKAVKQAPQNINILYSLSEDYQEARHDEKAIEVLQKVRKLDGDSLVPLYKIRDFHLKKENWEQAGAAQKAIMPLIDDDQELKREQNRFSEIIYAKGMSLYKQKQSELAIVEFKQAIRENGRSLPAYVTLGDIYFQADDLKKALKIWKAGFENTKSPVCLQRIQEAHRKLGNPHETIKLYQKAISSARNSEKETLALMLGAVFLDQGKPDEAINTLSAVPRDRSLLHGILLTKAYRAKNNPDKVEKTSQAVFDAARRSILSYTCNVCKAPMKEWSGHCPVCKAWDSASNGPALNVQSANTN